MTDIEKLDALKALLEESDTCRTLTDDQLTACLESADGDVRGAAYLGALRKSRVDGITLPDGTTLPSNREYWLSVAAMYRPNHGGPMPRMGRR